MSGRIWLEDHPPHVRQYYVTRAAPVRPQIVVHTAENALDMVGADASAENVAAFIANRPDAGSYHSVVDSDSTVRVGRYEWTMFHVRRYNSQTLGLSFACRTTDWPTMGAFRRAGFLRQGADEASRMSDWLRVRTGLAVPARRLNAEQFHQGLPGFIDHARLDPTRRSDPGADFPWVDFLATYQGGSTMATTNPYPNETREALDLLAKYATYTDTDRKWFGPKALAALGDLVEWHLTEVAVIEDQRLELARREARVTEQAATIEELRGEATRLEALVADQAATIKDLQGQLDLAKELVPAVAKVARQALQRALDQLKDL